MSLAAAITHWRLRRFCHAQGMKLNLAVVIGAILASSSGAHTVEGVERPQVLVCMERGADPSNVIPQAKDLTTRMFDQIGVALVWHGLEHCPEELKPVVIRVSVDTPHGVFPGALAVSYPFEGVHIRVFYDRVRAAAPSCPLPLLLAHVLAHEIGHILKGTNGHSPSGVMKGLWDRNDFARMAHQPFAFGEVDIKLIHRGLDARADRPSGERSPELAIGKRPTF